MTILKATTAQVDTYQKLDGTVWNFAEPKYISPWQYVTQGGNFFFAHGLGRQPYMVQAYAKNVAQTGDPTRNYPAVMVGSLGVWASNAGSDYGCVLGVSNTLICVGAGEQGWSTDWGSDNNNGFPVRGEVFEQFFTTYGQNSTNDFMDTPTETASTWSNAWVQVFAW
jgi:hypothetical protein